MRNVVSGTIRLSTVYSIGLHELPPYLKKFLREFPSVNVHVEYRRSNQVYDEVSEGTSDLGLVAFPVQKKTLKVEPFRKDGSSSSVCRPTNWRRGGDHRRQIEEGKIHRVRARH